MGRGHPGRRRASCPGRMGRGFSCTTVAFRASDECRGRRRLGAALANHGSGTRPSRRRDRQYFFRSILPSASRAAPVEDRHRPAGVCRRRAGRLAGGVNLKSCPLSSSRGPQPDRSAVLPPLREGGLMDNPCLHPPATSRRPAPGPPAALLLHGTAATKKTCCSIGRMGCAPGSALLSPARQG